MAPHTRSDASAGVDPQVGPRATVPAGTWVELRIAILAPGERAPGIPADTQAHPFVGRVRGFLTTPAALGKPATVRTLIGRTVRGELSAVHPRNPADFGDPSAELLEVGARIGGSRRGRP